MTIQQILEHHKVLTQHGTDRELIEAHDELLKQFTTLAKMFCLVNGVNASNQEIRT